MTNAQGSVNIMRRLGVPLVQTILHSVTVEGNCARRIPHFNSLSVDISCHFKQFL
jgi:hypothetical protein